MKFQMFSLMMGVLISESCLAATIIACGLDDPPPLTSSCLQLGAESAFLTGKLGVELPQAWAMRSDIVVFTDQSVSDRHAEARLEEFAWQTLNLKLEPALPPQPRPSFDHIMGPVSEWFDPTSVPEKTGPLVFGLGLISLLQRRRFSR